MKIYFVRHGQTQYNKDRRITGQVDVPLIEEGIEQARKAIVEIPEGISEIYSSDLIRCKQTTDILNEKLNLHVKYDARLRERNFGSLEGKMWDEIDPVIWEKDKVQEYDYHPYGGESVEDVKKRILAMIVDIRRKRKGDKVLVVTSAGVIRLLHKIISGEVHAKIDNSSIHEFEYPDTIEMVVAGGVVVNDGKAILVSQQGGTFWSLPKGGVDEGEDVIIAARREIYEETGVTELEYIKPLGGYDRYKLNKDNTENKCELKHLQIFLFKTKEIELAPKDKDNPEAIWVPIEQLTKTLTHETDRAFIESVMPEILK